MNLRKVKTETITVYEISTELTAKDLQRAYAFNPNSVALVDEDGDPVFVLGYGSKQFISDDDKLVNLHEEDANHHLLYAESYESLAKDEDEMITARLALLADRIKQVEGNVKKTITKLEKVIASVDVIDVTTPTTVQVGGKK